MADQSPPPHLPPPPPKSLFCIVILGEILSRKAGLLHPVTGSLLISRFLLQAEIKVLPFLTLLWIYQFSKRVIGMLHAE